MELATKDIDDFINPSKSPPQQSEALSKLNNRIENGEIKIQEVIKSLADYLTSNDGLIRSRGILLIGELLNNTKITLEVSEGATLAQFFGARLLDNASRREVICGIKALIKNFLVEEASNEDNKNESPIEFLIRSMFNELHIPSLPFPQRKEVCEIFLLILEKYSERVNKKMGRDFVVGVIQAIDQEKDPRNLKICFQLTQEVIKKIPVYKEFKEEIFEVITCYFPVDIKNSKQNTDNNDVVEELNQMILDTISITEEFIQFSIPYFLEMISETPNEKKVLFFSSFYYIIQKYLDPSRVYSSNTHPIQHFKNVWGVFRTEIFYSKDNEVIEAAQETLREITGLLSKDLVHSFSINEKINKEESVVEEFLKPIIKDCNHQLASPSNMNNDSKLAKQCITLLASLASSSTEACKLIVNSTLNTLLSIYNSDDTVQHRLTSNRWIVSILKACNDCYLNEKSNFSFLSAYKEPIYLLFNENLQNSQSPSLLKASCVLGIQYLVILSSDLKNRLLTEEECKECVEILTNLIITISADPDQSPQRRSLTALLTISHYNINLICSVTIPKLIATIGESLKSNSFGSNKIDEDDDWASEEEEAQSDLLQSLSSLSSHKESFIIIIPQIIEWVSFLANEKEDSNNNLPKFLGELKKIISKAKLLNLVDASQFAIPSLLSLLLKRFFITKHPITPADQTLFSYSADIFSIITQQSGQEGQVEIMRSFINLFIHQKNEFKLLLSEDEIKELTNFKPLNDNSESNSSFQKLFLAIINSSHAATLYDHQDDLQFAIKFFLATINDPNSSEQQIELNSQAIGILVNKSERSFMSPNITPVLDKIAVHLNNDIPNFPPSLVPLLTWITKGLCMKNDPHGWKLVELFPNFLQFPDKEKLFVDIIEKIMKDSPIFSSDNFLTIKPLFKQKFFSITKAQILRSFKENNQKGAGHLVAMSSLLQYLEPDLLQLEIPSIFPILRQSLSSESIEVIESSLSSILLLAKSSPITVESHIDTLVPLLLQLVTFKRSFVIRKKAIDCLSSFLTLPHYILFRIRDDIIYNLKDALDDPKRDVRVAATNCRNRWYTKKE